jgi:hypothetical protein
LLRRDPQLSQPILDIVARIYQKLAGSEDEHEDHDEQADIPRLLQQFSNPSSVPSVDAMEH